MAFTEYYKDLFQEKCIGKHGDQLKLCGVYKITNTTNGDFYIGSTGRDFYQRFLNHFHSVTNKNYPKSTHLVRAYLKYGLENFSFDLIEITKSKDAVKKEQFYMDKMSPKYNTNPKAGTTLGVKRTQNQRDKLSKSKLKYINEDDVIKDYNKKLGSKGICRKYKIGPKRLNGILLKNKIKRRPSSITNRALKVIAMEKDIVIYYKLGNSARACSGKFKISLSSTLRILRKNNINTSKFKYKPSKEQKSRQSESLKGRIFSKKQKERLSKAKKGTLLNGKNPMAKKVIDVEAGIIYETIKQAAASLNINSSTLMDRISGRSKIKTTYRLY